MMITDSDKETYQLDGAVCVRGLFDKHWIEVVRQGIASAIANPGPHGENYNPGGAAFYGDLDMWQRHPEFKDFVFNSPAAQAAAALMDSRAVNFFYDQMLVKEPGSETTTPWHQDQPYWAISGKQVCSIWMPVDPVEKDVCLEFVAGSHRWGKEFNPQHFSDQTPYEGTGLEAIPDIDAARENYKILSWALQPGDCIIFQAMMVHGAKGNNSTSTRRRVLSTRWAGDDARYCKRPGETAIPTFDSGLTHGDKLSGDKFPAIWPPRSNTC